MKRKFLSKILISFIAIAILLAPISPTLEKQNEKLALETKINKTNAQTSNESNTATIEVTPIGKITTTSANFEITINDINHAYSTSFYEESTGFYSSTENGMLMVDVISKDNYINGIEEYIDTEVFDVEDEQPQTETFSIDSELEKNTEYYMFVTLQKTKTSGSFRYLYNSLSGEGNEVEQQGVKIRKITFDTTSGDITANELTTDNPEPAYSLDCGITNLGGCIAQILYTLWGASAWLASLAGSFLDFFVFYSINSDSYTSTFVTQGWDVIRDIANIFFIVALLYIAIKTILNLNVTNNKKLISAIVLMALLINFSLFFTQVIIDSSNILAKVFYNQIKSVDKNGEPSEAGAGGEKSISIGLVSKFNPQQVMSGEQANNNVGSFIFMVILLLAITLYTAYMFFTVAILFIGRVVSLWIAMIFAPLAFASYTVPFNIPGFGYKQWWNDLFKACFLAPMFIFFLYIIVLFTDLTKDAIGYATSSPDFIQKLMKTVIPFSIIFILLMKAKELAVSMSGDLGKALSKVGGTVLGVAGGAVMGAGALVGTGVVGSLASRMAGSESLKLAAEKKGLVGFGARMALKTGSFGSKASFDVRKTTAGSALGRAMGADFQAAKYLGLGTKAGGFEGITKRREEKIQKESELVKTKLTDAQVAEKHYKDKNGNDITTAVGLNNYRMQEYLNNVGKTSLLSSVAYSSVIATNGAKRAENKAIETYEKDHARDKQAFLDKKQKEYGNNAPTEAQKMKDLEEFEKNYKNKEDFIKTKKEENLDNEAKTWKMAIGGIGGVGLGAITGGAIGGTVLAGAIGGTGGLGGVLQEQEKILESERLARASLGKSLKGITDVGNRLKELNTLLTKQKDVLTIGKEKFGNLFGSDNKINETELNNKIAEYGVKDETFKEKMRLLTKTIHDQGGEEKLGKNHPDVQKLRAEESKYATHVVESKILKSLEEVESKIEDTEQKIFIAKGGNQQTGTQAKNTNTTNFRPPTTPSTPATPTK